MANYIHVYIFQGDNSFTEAFTLKLIKKGTNLREISRLLLKRYNCWNASSSTEVFISWEVILSWWKSLFWLKASVFQILLVPFHFQGDLKFFTDWCCNFQSLIIVFQFNLLFKVFHFKNSQEPLSPLLLHFLDFANLEAETY